eukprot:6196889-Pleurochrysis_carterae.AAC.7
MPGIDIRPTLLQAFVLWRQRYVHADSCFLCTMASAIPICEVADLLWASEREAEEGSMNLANNSSYVLQSSDKSGRRVCRLRLWRA